MIKYPYNIIYLIIYIFSKSYHEYWIHDFFKVDDNRLVLVNEKPHTYIV